MSEYWKEFFLVVALAVGVSLFVIGFKPVFKVAVGGLPLPVGMKEALAA